MAVDANGTVHLLYRTTVDHDNVLNYTTMHRAARMGTSASVVSKLEAGGDVKLSTLQRYCAAIGEKLPIAV